MMAVLKLAIITLKGLKMNKLKKATSKIQIKFGSNHLKVKLHHLQKRFLGKQKLYQKLRRITTSSIPLEERVASLNSFQHLIVKISLIIFSVRG